MDQPVNEDSVATAIRRLEDEGSIASLVYRYAYHFDRNEPDAVAALFTPDATIDYGPELPPIVGRDRIVARIAPGLDEVFVATSHHISNVIIELDGDTASAIAYVYAWHRYHDGSPDGYLWGQYHIEARRDPDGWRIAKLTLKAVAVTDFHRAQMHPIGRRGGDRTLGTDTH